MREVAACTRCALRAGCQQTVPGEGHAAPEILFVGEGPGAEEDTQGRPFVGPAGQLLTKMIAAMRKKAKRLNRSNAREVETNGGQGDGSAPLLRASYEALRGEELYGASYFA